MYCRFLLIADFSIIAVAPKLKLNHVILNTCFLLIINVGGELLLGGAYSDSVFKANSDFSGLYTSIKKCL